MLVNSVLIVGVIRNCSSKINYEIQILDEAFSDFDRNYFFIESDSTDDTVKELNDIAFRMINFQFLTLGKLEVHVPNRISRLAHCRNLYMEYIQGIGMSKLPSYVVVADMDGVNTKLSKKSVETCFQLDSWEVCTANQKGPYYDIYALQAPNWNEGNLADNYSKNLAKFKLHALAYYFTVIHKMIKKRGHNQIEVASAFGGLAIYKTSVLLNKKYSETDEYGKILCEHVSLHKSILNSGGRIIINPKLINSGWTTNSRRAFLKLLGLSLLGKRYYYFKEPGI